MAYSNIYAIIRELLVINTLAVARQMGAEFRGVYETAIPQKLKKRNDTNMQAWYNLRNILHVVG